MPYRACLFLTSSLLIFSAFSASSAVDSSPAPLSPRDERATFKVPKGFKVELVASEPDVVDPVAMAFDEQGRLFVAEMRGYPNGGVATGQENRGRIKLLVDEDGDGVYEKSVIFADGLRFPTSVMPWKGGLIVANAPELIYLADTDGDGKADRQRVLYTGFNLDNIQQLVNSLQWGLDNWIYACAGNNGGTVHSAEKPETPPVTLRGRGLRFHPDVPGSLEPTSGGGQYGLAPDNYQHWFTATNSQHLRQIVLPDHYLRRNPFLTVPAVTFDIPDHGAACKVDRISPFEAWRVERTTRRKGGPEATRFPSTELVPGGYITSACSPVVYEADLFPAEYRGNTFVCDPANNLIHRDVLEAHGSLFTAKRGDEDCEFLASTDNWFRPVWLTIGPEGALYVLDFYREVIETPLSLPDDIKKRLNLESRGRGRIWRIVPDGFKHPPRVNLAKATAGELVEVLKDANLWRRLTAQRLLIERQDRSAVEALRKLAGDESQPVGRVHALWTLHGLKALDASLVVPALKAREPGVREQALRLADESKSGSAPLTTAVLALANDPDAHVRFQFALSVGALPPDRAGPALTELLKRTDNDAWMHSAILSSSKEAAAPILESLMTDSAFAKTTAARGLLNRLAAMIGAQGNDSQTAQVLKLLADVQKQSPTLALALLEGLGQGMQNTARPLSKLWDKPPETLADAVNNAHAVFHQAAQSAAEESRPLPERVAAIHLLAHAPASVAIPALRELLVPQAASELQTAVVRALAVRGDPEVSTILLAGWQGHGPELRRAVLEALFARPERIAALLDAVEQKRVLGAQLGAERIDQLRRLPDARLRKRATALLAGQVATDRQKAVDSYRPALDLTADAVRGKAVFKKNCAACHRLDNEGYDVGANLMAALRTKTKEALLVDILDPSREVDPRYVNYEVTTLGGRTMTGILAVETPSSITLRRAERQEDTILRAQIESIRATSKSLMPDEFEKQISQQELADLIEYLLHVIK
jgi:putative membrane-bound dehydrogenase-like protein